MLAHRGTTPSIWQEIKEMYPNYTPKDEERFWKKVDKSDHPKGCWLWMACADKDGYGFIKWQRKQVKAHRVSYLLANGEYMDKLMVLHTCDNPGCVNPQHLFLGTAKNNAEDRDRKNRGNAASKEQHGNSKLTQSQVDHLRERVAKGQRGTQRQIAKELHISESQVSHIIHELQWKSD